MPPHLVVSVLRLVGHLIFNCSSKFERISFIHSCLLNNRARCLLAPALPVRFWASSTHETAKTPSRNTSHPSLAIKPLSPAGSSTTQSQAFSIDLQSFVPRNERAVGGSKAPLPHDPMTAFPVGSKLHVRSSTSLILKVHWFCPTPWISTQS